MSTEMERPAATIGAEVTLCEEAPMVRRERWEEIRRLWVAERLPIARLRAAWTWIARPSAAACVTRRGGHTAVPRGRRRC